MGQAYVCGQESGALALGRRREWAELWPVV